METFDIIQLVRYGQVDEILNILDRAVPTRKCFLRRTGSNLNQFIGLAARTGSIEILRRCNIKYGVEIGIGSELGLDAIVGAASRGHNHVIEWLLEPWVESKRLIEQRQHPNKVQFPQGWLCPSLHKAIQGQHVSTVELLVKKAKADVNARDVGRLRPIQVAADPVNEDDLEQMSRYEEIIDILVTNGALVNDLRPHTQTTALYDAVRLNSRKAIERLIDGGADVCIPCTEDKITVLHLVAEAGLGESLRILLDRDRLRQKAPCDFDVRDKNGATPLHTAAYGGNTECVRILIKKGLSLISKNTDDITVMKTIFERVPNPIAFLTEILDEQVTATDKSGNDITIDFRLLASKHSSDREHKFPNMDVVVALINSARNMEQLSILQHPVLETFLRLQYSIKALLHDVLVFLLHLLFAGSLWWHSTHSDQLMNPRNSVLRSILFILGMYVAFANLARTGILHSKVKLDKLDMFLLYTSCFISIMSYFYQSLAIADPVLPLEVENLSLIVYLRSIMVLLSWINVMLLSVPFPLIGEYSFMFFAVLMNIGKVLFSFTCLITGFALSFSILFSDNNQFDSLWKAFAKTLVMMTGEFEYGNLFSPTDQSNFTSTNTTTAKNNDGPLQIPGIIFFLIFVIVSSITLINFMIGLAVNDIQELRKEGRTRRLMTQANCAAAVGWFSFCINRIPKKLKLNLNSRSWMNSFRVPTNVKTALRDLGLKNYNRKKRPKTDTSNDNTQDILTAIQTSCAAMESSLVAMQSFLQITVIEQRLQNYQMKRLTQDRKPKWHRRSL